MSTPGVRGIVESALYVDDVKRSESFYSKIFGFEVMVSDDRFCAMEVPGRQVFLLFKKGATHDPLYSSGGVIPPHDGDGNLHMAFGIEMAAFNAWVTWLGKNNIPIESTVEWPRGGKSLYFRDPDHHVIELVTPGCWANY